jgi:hypothetical protein
VVTPGVGLDDEGVRLEEEVDLLAEDAVVDLRLREAVGPAEALEADLEAALGDVGSCVVAGEGSQQPLGSAVAGMGACDGSE